MTKWEYKVVIDTYTAQMEACLNRLGEEGWELVATTPCASTVLSCRSLIFKREKQQPVDAPKMLSDFVLNSL